MSLTSVLSSISYSLGNSRASWDEQREAVKKLRGLCSQYGNMFKANYIDINIKMGLIRCVGDNRSGLVTETCLTIIDLCSTIGQSMESIAGDIFINIIEKAASGVSLISQAVTDCCINMVKCLYMEKVILNLDRFLNHRSDKVQITTANCLKLIVSYWPESIIRKHYHTLSNLVEAGVKAPRSEVRSLMRESHDILNQKFGNENLSTPKSSYNSPYKSIAPSKSTAIKSIQPGIRNAATPRGLEIATKKTGIVPRTVETPKYKQSRTTYTPTAHTSTPTKPVNSRIVGNNTSTSSAYMVNKTRPSSPHQTSGPRKPSVLSASRIGYGSETPETLARMDRELEKVPVDQKIAYSMFQRVRVRGKDGKLHPALIQYAGRTKGSKKIMYGVIYQDGYKPDSNGTYYNRHYGPKDMIISEYVFETDILPFSPSTPNRPLSATRTYQEQPVLPPISKEEVEQVAIEKLQDSSENMKTVVTLLKDFHLVETSEESRRLCTNMVQKLKQNVDNVQQLIEKLQLFTS